MEPDIIHLALEWNNYNDAASWLTLVLKGAEGVHDDNTNKNRMIKKIR